MCDEAQEAFSPRRKAKEQVAEEDAHGSHAERKPVSKEGDALMEFQRAQKGRVPKRRYAFGLSPKPVRLAALSLFVPIRAISAQSENVSMSNVSIIYVSPKEVSS